MADDASRSTGGWGGWRPGAGRKRGKRPRVRHHARAELDPRFPALITWRLLRWMPSLSNPAVCAMWKELIVPREHFHVLDWTLQIDHLHLIAAAASSDAMRRGLTGLASSFARRLNRLIGNVTGGRVFDHRYDARALTTRESLDHCATRYVHENWKKHGHAPRDTRELDVFSSARDQPKMLTQGTRRGDGMQRVGVFGSSS